MVMQTINASEFKAKCLQWLDAVNETGEEIVITKSGKPVSKLVPYREPSPTLFGLHQGRIKFQDDLIEPTGEIWEAESCS